MKLRGNRSQLDRAGVYLKRGVGSFKEREKEERVVTEVRSERKKRSSNKDRDSDNENDYEMRKYKNEYEKSDRKVEVRDREVVLDSGPWKSLDRDREEKDKKDKEEFVSVAVTVPCPASRAGCLIGSKGTQSLHHITLHYTTLNCTSLYCTTLHYTTLHNTTLHYTALHYTTLYTQLVISLLHSTPLCIHSSLLQFISVIILLYLFLSYLVLYYLVLSYLVLSYLILSYFCFFLGAVVKEIMRRTTARITISDEVNKSLIRYFVLFILLYLTLSHLKYLMSSYQILYCIISSYFISLSTISCS